MYGPSAPLGLPSNVGAIPVQDATTGKTLALDGTDATGVSAPSGATGIRGWLSAIFALLPKLTTAGSSQIRPEDNATTATGSATAVGTIWTLASTSGSASVDVSVTTIGAGNVVQIMAYDGTNWYQINGISASGGSVGPAGITAVGLYTFPATGQQIRAQLTTFVTGSVVSSVSSRAKAPANALPVDPIQTVTASLAAAGTVYQFSSTAGAETLDIECPTSAAGSTLSVQGSNDGTTWSGITGISAAGMAVVNFTATSLTTFPVVGTYMRILATGYTSGTTTIISSLRAKPFAPFQTTQQVSLTGIAIQPNLSAAASLKIRVNSAATTNATSVKTTNGRIFSMVLSNTTTATVYFRLYDLATAPTVGTSAITLTIPLLANSTQTFNFTDLGMNFAAGIAYSITGALADTDATAVTAQAVTGIIQYF